MDIQKPKHHHGQRPGSSSETRRGFGSVSEQVVPAPRRTIPLEPLRQEPVEVSRRALHGYTPRVPLAPASHEAIQAFRQQSGVGHSMAGRRQNSHRMTFKYSRLKLLAEEAKYWVARLRPEESGELFASFFQVRRLRFAMGTLAAVGCLWGGSSFVMHGLRIKGEVLGMSTSGVDQLQLAVDNVKQKNFSGSEVNFDDAAKTFQEASGKLDELNGTVVELSRFIPGASKLASGKYALEAGEHLALAGRALNTAAAEVWDTRNNPDHAPILELFQTTKQSTEEALKELRAAQESLDRVSIDDLPEEKRAKFVELKEKLPQIIEPMEMFLAHSSVLYELFGGNGPRKYLFLLQNNQEIRATGGFIGTYGLLDISNGRVRTFKIDGIFNPDGQFSQNIVPPLPLQKVTGGWSLHDSNWFPDFPVSARKAISFFEKTGGPTTDGVITLTPAVIQKLLEVTGPVTMEKYGVTLDAENFLELVQDQVEFKYDKTLNKPKQILTDLAPILLDRVASVSDEDEVRKLLQVVEESLNEKHILLYSQNENVENIVRASGWSGEMIRTSKDYLSVVNTNVSGYKTDGVVDESIEHEAAIQSDGSIIDTVTISRKHNGGNTPYDFWNRVNADYMRVYVPEGSELLSAEGHTRETVKPPLDYDALRFVRDPDVEAEESTLTIHKESGTQIFTEAGKTVFANWVYVSPQETVTVKYVYRLPFRLQPSGDSSMLAGSYGAIFQKQSGSRGSKLTASVSYPDRLRSLWKTPETLKPYGSGARMETDLRTDTFYGIVLGK